MSLIETAPMKVISHRGNLTGEDALLENDPDHIDTVIDLGYDVEVDVWYRNGTWYLGHDDAEHELSSSWLSYRSSNLWIHAKDVHTFFALKSGDVSLNYFFHQEDELVLTSKGFIWGYPGVLCGDDNLTNVYVNNQPEFTSIDPVTIEEMGIICTDYPLRYKKPIVR